MRVKVDRVPPEIISGENTGTSLRIALDATERNYTGTCYLDIVTPNGTKRQTENLTRTDDSFFYALTSDDLITAGRLLVQAVFNFGTNNSRVKKSAIYSFKVKKSIYGDFIEL